MTVRELTEFLSTQDPDADVLLLDAFGNLQTIGHCPLEAVRRPEDIEGDGMTGHEVVLCDAENFLSP